MHVIVRVLGKQRLMRRARILYVNLAFSREKERYQPEESCRETVNSSRWSSVPETSWPEARWTVTLAGAGGFTAFPRNISIMFGAGYNMRRCSSTASYFPATCARSPDGE